jgi:hypothetical protein
MNKATPAERDYFVRIARANVALQDDEPPGSLEEMFDRLDRIRRELGALALPGILGGDDGDLDGHLRFLARQQVLLRRGTSRS